MSLEDLLPHEERDRVFFEVALRRGVDPLFLRAMWEYFHEQPLEEWAHRMAVFLRDMLPEYYGNPLATEGSARAEGPRRLCYSISFVSWFGEKWAEYSGQQTHWMRAVTERYRQLVRGE